MNKNSNVIVSTISSKYILHTIVLNLTTIRRTPYSLFINTRFAVDN